MPLYETTLAETGAIKTMDGLCFDNTRRHAPTMDAQCSTDPSRPDAALLFIIRKTERRSETCDCCHRLHSPDRSNYLSKSESVVRRASGAGLSGGTSALELKAENKSKKKQPVGAVEYGSEAGASRTQRVRNQIPAVPLFPSLRVNPHGYCARPIRICVPLSREKTGRELTDFS